MWNVALAAHELGHLLGADHDDDCSDAEIGYIMTASTGDTEKELRFYFSRCSDESIAAFLKTSDADCLRKADISTENEWQFPENVDPPTLAMHCQRASNFTVGLSEDSNCLEIWCLVNENNVTRELDGILPVDGSLCITNNSNGTCDRGVCVGESLQNDGDYYDPEICVEIEELLCLAILIALIMMVIAAYKCVNEVLAWL